MSGDRSHSYSDILPVFREHFIKDFDSRDAEHTLRTILKRKEVDVIIKSLLPEQVYRLFWTLDNQDENVVKQFVFNMADYDFLMEKIKMEYVNPSPDTKTYFSAIDRLNNDNQKFSKYNVPRMKPYLELQKALLNLSESKNVVIQGVLGAGKQWLALDVCSSYIVQRKMNFEIYWINVRNCHSAESRLEQLQSFLHQLDSTYSCNSDKSIKLRIERIKTELRHRMQKKPKCLIVLCNVQNIETWEDFNFGCKILLTTRHKVVANFLSPSTTTHITLDDALTPFEIESLFAKYLRNKPLELTEEHYRYLKTTNPLKLSIIAEYISEGRGTLDNWKNIDIINAELRTYILNSLNALKANEDDDNFYKYLFKLYTNLFIFPESAQIPIRLLGIIWDVEEPMKIVNKFNNFSLVEKHSNNRTISIPDIYSELKLVNTNELVLNMKIVNYYNIPTLFGKYDDTTTLPNLDCYFYEHIGHHLSKINDKNERVQYFRMIFLDFRFLEQKIRNDTTPWAARGSILHTLRTLKCYREEIADNDPHYEQLVSALLEFLPKVEEKLIRSQYTSLLQIALMSEDAAVYDEAQRQAKRFPNYVFFTEHGRFHQHRQIINLGQDQVRHAIYLNDDFCLMALNTSELLLTDVSLQGDLTHVLSDKNDHSSIIEMRVFNNEKHLLTLHSNGTLKLWSLHQLLSSRDDMLGSRQKVEPPKVDWTTKTGSHSYKQLVNDAVRRSILRIADLNITAFYLDEIVERHDAVTIQLHVAFVNGDICICNWDDKEEKFHQSHIPTLKTKEQHVRCFAKILKRFYVLCTANCRLTIWNLQNGELTHCYPINPNSTQSAISMEIYIERSFDSILKVHKVHTVLLLIHNNGVCKLRYEHAPFMEETPKPEDLPIFTAPITCGKLSQDNRYLILGTQKGIIVYDLKLSKSLLPSNVSENIVCVDVFDVNDIIYKYIVLCGAKGKHVVNVHTLQSIDKDTVSWVHHEHEDNLIYSQAQLEPDVYLLPLLKKSEDGGSLYAVDTKARIHQIPMEVHQSTGHRGSIANWSIIATQKIGPKIYITALCVGQDDTVYTGYSNGVIINVNENKKLLKEEDGLQCICYLKEINSKILIASSYNQTLIFVLSKPNPIPIPSYTFYARLFKNSHVFLFMEQAVIWFDLNDQLGIVVELDDTLMGFDLRDNYMYLASRDSKLTIHELHVVDDKLICQEIRNIEVIKSGCINYLTVSNDGELVAIGFKNGFIAIYKDVMSSEEPIYTIKQESSNEMRLRFSPCKQILVSCADLLCFWNVKYMLNNQVTPKRRSTRHKHAQPKALPGREEVDASPCTSDTDMHHQKHHPQRIEWEREADNKAYLWAHKQGFDKRPELLACIRFLGNEARHFYTSSDFSQFYVIDDEGSFYHLKVLEPLPEIPDHTAIERQLEMPHTEFNRGIDEQLVDNNDDVGTDIIENIDLRPAKPRNDI